MLAFFLPSSGFAQTIANSIQPSPGTFINGPIDPDMGRLSTIEYLGGYIVTIPESPGSESGDHRRVKAWNFSDLNNPFSVSPINPDSAGDFGVTNGPFLSHGSIKRDNEIYIGGYPNSAVRLNANGTLEHAPWSGPDLPNSLTDQEGNTISEIPPWWSKSGMMRPWAMYDDWSYNNPMNDTTLTLGDKLMAKWNITRDTGVAGFGNFIGNLLIYASDQRNTGVAVYDATDISFDESTGEWKPKLLDTLNTPLNEGGLGGYWSEISGQYIVFARRGENSNPASFAGIQIVDFSDPSNLRLQCNIDVGGGMDNIHWSLSNEPMYVGFQDEYVFTDKFKVNIETCEVELTLDTTLGQTGSLCYGGGTCPALTVSTSQYSRIIGNLWFTGGYPTVPNVDGMAVWAHQSEPDTNKPYIAYHIPRPNQTNYPITAPLGFSIPETLRSQTVVVTATADPGEAETLTLTEVGGGKIDIDYVISHTGMLTVDPVQDLRPNTTYEVAFTSGILDAAGNAMQPYSFRFSTGNAIDVTGPSDPANITNITTTPDGDIDLLETVTVAIGSGNATEYQIALDGEVAVWQATASRSFSFDQTGEYFVNARARNADGVSALQRVRLNVLNVSGSATLSAGKNSGQLFCDADNQAVWAVNPDNNSITKIDSETNIKLFEVGGPEDPQSVTRASSGEIWVTARNEDLVYIYSADGAVVRTLNTGYGSAPTHILASNNGSQIYVTLYGSGEVLKYDLNIPGNLAPSSVNVGPTPKAMALSPDGKTLLVTRFISDENWGEVYDIDVASWSLTKTYKLEKHLVDDQLNEGRGVPNYLAGIIISGDGARAFVVGKKDNVDRGLLNGLGVDLDDDNTIRTIAMVLDLNSGTELRGQRLDFDNASSPSALAMSKDGRALLVAMQGKNSVIALSLDGNYQFTGSQSDIVAGLAPQGLCLDSVRNKLFVKNFTERTVTVADLSTGLSSPDVSVISTVENEILSANELSGLQVFYNAFNGLEKSNPVGKMSAEGYISCASCHMDGGQDGRTYDFTGRNEGLRNNISLKGRSGIRFGNVHWSANFDEIQDFEHDIRGPQKGLGLMTDAQFAQANTPLGSKKAGLSQELDDLAMYVATLGKESLPRSPFRSVDGSNTASANVGGQIFTQLGCVACHSGTALTDKTQHDVGTLRSSSGKRLGELLTGIKTPSLLGVFATAPYLHDGSAKTLEAVFETIGGDVLQAEDSDLNSADIVTNTGYSYLRGAAGARLSGSNNSSVIFSNVNGGSGGSGKIRVRYGSTLQSAGNLQIRVNGGGIQTISLAALPQVEGQDVAYIESGSLDIDLVPGSGNSISIGYTGTNVILDEITVSNADDMQVAEVHTIVGTISSADRSNLIDFLLQLDQASAPEDNEVDIFTNPQSTLPATVSFTASKNTVPSGGSITLSWTTANVNVCTASGGWSGSKSTSGSETVSPDSTTTYILSCSNDGDSATDSVLISVVAEEADSTPPSTPNNIASSDTTSTSTRLSWGVASDNVGVTAYKIFRNGTFEAETTGASYEVTGLVADTRYSFTVSARDAAANESIQSSTLIVTTLSASDDSTVSGVFNNWSSKGRYVIGSGVDLVLTLNDSADAVDSVIFQVWSSANGVESASYVGKPPYIYKSALLDAVVPGSGKYVQALLRDSNGNIIHTVNEEATFTISSGSDTDGDSVSDSQDNCPWIANPGQEDRNGNGTGDVCDVKTTAAIRAATLVIIQQLLLE